MNDLLQNIMERRSIRSYTGEQISDEALDTILKAAIYAPSGSNSQSWQFTVLQNKSILERLNQEIREAFQKLEVDESTYRSLVGGKKASVNSDYSFYYHAPTLIIASNVKTYPNAMADCAAAIQNMLLTAHGLDLGSCWINQLTWFGDKPKVRATLTELGVPENHVICGSVAVGYRAGQLPKAPARKEGTIHIVK